MGIINIQVTFRAKGVGEGNWKSLAREKRMKLDLVESACGRVAGGWEDTQERGVQNASQESESHRSGVGGLSIYIL